MKPHEIDHWFDHHPPRNEKVVRAHEVAREGAKEYAHLIDILLPDSAEKTLALRSLKDVLARVNEAIALQQVECDEDLFALKRRLQGLRRGEPT